MLKRIAQVLGKQLRVEFYAQPDFTGNVTAIVTQAPPAGAAIYHLGEPLTESLFKEFVSAERPALAQHYTTF